MLRIWFAKGIPVAGSVISTGCPVVGSVVYMQFVIGSMSIVRVLPAPFASGMVPPFPNTKPPSIV